MSNATKEQMKDEAIARMTLLHIHSNAIPAGFVSYVSGIVEFEDGVRHVDPTDWYQTISNIYRRLAS